MLSIIPDIYFRGEIHMKILLESKYFLIQIVVTLIFIVCFAMGTSVQAENILLLTLPIIMAGHGHSGGGTVGGGTGGSGTGGGTSPPATGDYVVIAWNDLGMHCIDESFEDFGLLPPYNTLVAQVIKRGKEPKIVTRGLKVTYRILDNTSSDTKTDFWDFAGQLFGVSLASNMGLAGFGLQGSMRAEQDSFIAEGIPLTPFSDSAPDVPAPYQIAEIKVFDSQGNKLAATRTVAPVSTEITCNACHDDRGKANPGIATGVVKRNILTLHDQKEGTSLMANRPILCANCHASAALNKPGKAGLPSLSKAMHGKHRKIDDGTMAGTCYRCHPGTQTKCLRGIMFQKGQTCQSCHGNLRDIASSSRRPWIDEPRCGQCHDSAYSQPANTLYRFSRGHHGVFCQACHGSQHAIYPTVNPEDNAQSIRLQGHGGTIDTCRVCHTNDPDAGEGPHGGGSDD